MINQIEFTNDPVSPSDNTIDLNDLDLCDHCKYKILDAFRKAYIIGEDNG